VSSEEGRPLISIFRAAPRPIPFSVKSLERHPLSSQAFYPLDATPFLVVVAKDGDHGGGTGVRGSSVSRRIGAVPVPCTRWASVAHPNGSPSSAPLDRPLLPGSPTRGPSVGHNTAVIGRRGRWSRQQRRALSRATWPGRGSGLSRSSPTAAAGHRLPGARQRVRNHALRAHAIILFGDAEAAGMPSGAWTRRVPGRAERRLAAWPPRPVHLVAASSPALII